jgi:hypothetical protein
MAEPLAPRSTIREPIFRPSAPAMRRVLRFALAGSALALASSLLPIDAVSQNLSERVVTRLGLKTATPAASLSPANLPGFKRHGTSLVGMVQTEDGATMRLVFDARTATLIGIKAVAPAARTEKGCISLSIDAPLPGRTTPAN